MKQWTKQEKIKIVKIASKNIEVAIDRYIELRGGYKSYVGKRCQIRKNIRWLIRNWIKIYNSNNMELLTSKTGKTKGGGRPKKPVPADIIWDRLEEKEKYEIFKDWLKKEREKEKSQKMKSQSAFSKLIKQARRLEIWDISKEGIRKSNLKSQEQVKITKTQIVKQYILDIAKEHSADTHKGTVYIEGRDGVANELANKHNISLSPRYVGKLMSSLGVTSNVRRKRKVKEHKVLDQVEENIANRDYSNPAIYSMDVKYIEHKHKEGNHIFLEPIINWETKFIENYSIEFAQGADQTLKNLSQVVFRKNAILHTDRGAQYCSSEVKDFLEQNKITKSLSRKGNCWDNRESEHFFGNLQSECLNFYSLNDMSLEEIKKLISDYIYYYNYKRKQKQLGWKTPFEFKSSKLLNGQLFCS